MPLAELQAALGTMVSMLATNNQSPTAAPIRLFNLTADEQRWLSSLPETRGFKVTCAIQRWWRETRLRDTARLTIAALGKARTAQMLDEYLRASFCTTLFFLPETLAFLRFVTQQTDDPQLSAIAQFELALLRAREEASQYPTGEPTSFTSSSPATYIEFANPPEEILAALLQGQTLPEPQSERFHVIVSPHLPHFWCPAEASD